MTAKDWYKNRNDRFKRVEGLENVSFESFKLGVIIFDSDQYENQIMGLVALNTATRWCQNITIQLKDSRCLIRKYVEDSYKNLLNSIATQNDPYGDFQFKDIIEDDHDLILVIGKPDLKLKDPYVWIDSNGWLAGSGYGFYENHVHIRKNDRNILGAAFSACIGTSKAFKIALGQKVELASRWFSLFDFSHSSNSNDLVANDYDDCMDLGNVFQIGCGAIGSSFSFLISLTNWKGNVSLIDYDAVANHNCGASLLFTKSHSDADIKKVDVCMEALVNTFFNTQPIYSDYDSFLKEVNYKISPDIILCFANEKNIWSSIQNNYPPLTFHSTTNKSWGINFGRHIPFKEWCLMCRFKTEEIEQPKLPCGQGAINTPINEEHEILGVLPFLPAASAILCLADLAKIKNTQYPTNSNFIEFSFRGSFDTKFIHYNQKPRPCYICKDQSIKFYPKRTIESKYFKLSIG